MINDKDVQKLKKVFVTKEYFRKELKKELSKYATKKEMQQMFDSFALEIAQDMGEMIQEQKEVNKRIDATLDELRSNRIVLGNHEERIQNVETKVFPSTSSQ